MFIMASIQQPAQSLFESITFGQMINPLTQKVSLWDVDWFSPTLAIVWRQGAS